MFKIPKYQLYLLQLENYELGRYLRLIFKKGLLPPKLGLRKSLVWTMKARLLFFCAFFMHLFLSVTLFLVCSDGLLVFSIKYLVLSILFFIILIPLYFIPYTLYIILLWPVDWLVKQIIIVRAKSRITELTTLPPSAGPLLEKEGMKSGLKIIGITGSYGKTTMKEVLLEVLGQKFNTAATPESVNTPVGIARWILKKFSSPTPSPALPYGRASSPARGEENIEIALVEMGEHYRGDIIELCKLTPPDIAVITGINEAHLERMGTMDNIVATIFEIAQGMKPGGVLMLNGDDKKVVANYGKYLTQRQRVEKYLVSSIKYLAFDTQALCWKLQIDDIGEVKLHLLGEYALGDVDCAIKIGRTLGMSNEEIKSGIEKIRPVPHRLEPKFAPGNILVIDDAYNGNSDGAREAIKVLSRFVDRRKIYITPGLVETGSQTAEIHREIGRQLASAADVVILIRNSVTGFIEEGVNSQQSIVNKQPEVMWFDTAQEAHVNLSKILKPSDVILFQNDWGDQYL